MRLQQQLMRLGHVELVLPGKEPRHRVPDLPADLGADVHPRPTDQCGPAALGRARRPALARRPAIGIVGQEGVRRHPPLPVAADQAVEGLWLTSVVASMPFTMLARCVALKLRGWADTKGWMSAQ